MFLVKTSFLYFVFIEIYDIQLKGGEMIGETDAMIIKLMK